MSKVRFRLKSPEGCKNNYPEHMMKSRCYFLSPPLTPSIAQDLAQNLRPLLKAGAFSVFHGTLTEEGAFKEVVGALKDEVQRADCAFLMDAPSDLRLVDRNGLDGIVLQIKQDQKQAFAALKPERIIGIAGITTRHEAMLAGETGADFVGIGLPYHHQNAFKIEHLSFAQNYELCSWWNSIFVVPLVSYAHNLEEAIDLAKIDVDFIALGDWIFKTPDPLSIIKQITSSFPNS